MAGFDCMDSFCFNCHRRCYMGDKLTDNGDKTPLMGHETNKVVLSAVRRSKGKTFVCKYKVVNTATKTMLDGFCSEQEANQFIKNNL